MHGGPPPLWPLQEAHTKEGRPLVDGYAPFCKHIFVPNFTGAPVGALPITDANRHLLQSGAPPARGGLAAGRHQRRCGRPAPRA